MAQQPSAYTLRPPLSDAQIVNPNGFPTEVETTWRTNLTLLLQQISGIQVSISGGDATAGLNQAIGQAIKQGGGTVMLPAGSYTISSPVSIPFNSPPIWIIGQGPATILTRSGNMPAGMGIFDISSDYVTLSDFVIDGGTTTPVGLLYGSGFSTALNANDPMAPSLTTNTSVWLHGPATNLAVYRMGFRHAGGYSILLDATSGDISDIDIDGCYLVNNRPTLFGTVAGQAIYGSWNGGILAKGDGRTASGSESGVVSGRRVEGCSFQRGTGNQLWSHNFGFARLHSQFRYSANKFLDCGLDAILVDCVNGGSVDGNIMRRIGYTTLTDTDQSVPRWLVNLNATGIDSGVVQNVPYTGNSLTSVNGGMVDLDGHGQGDLTGNVCTIPLVGDPRYVEDQIAITGPTNSGNGSYGFNMGNTYSYEWGCIDVNMTGNTFINLPSGSIRLYSARRCKVIANIFDVPATSTIAPIQMGPQGTGPYQRCFNNKISHNDFNYSPASAKPCVKEDGSITPFLNTESNYVFGNQPIYGNGNATEFSPSSPSASPTYAATVWFP